MSTLHHYVIVRADLPVGTLVAMCIHAAGESGGGVPPGTHAVALSAPDEHALAQVEDRLVSNGIPHHAVREPDAPWDGALMAIGIEPMVATNPNLRRVVKRLRLLR